MKSNIVPALRGDDEFPALLDVVRDHFARAAIAAEEGT